MLLELNPRSAYSKIQGPIHQSLACRFFLVARVVGTMVNPDDSCLKGRGFVHSLQLPVLFSFDPKSVIWIRTHDRHKTLLLVRRGPGGEHSYVFIGS